MANHHPSPTMAMQMGQHGPNGPPGPPGSGPASQPYGPPSSRIHILSEALWMQIGSLSEALGNIDDAMFAYEYALRANPKSIPALNAMSLILRTKEDFGKAIEYLQIILGMDNTNGEVWGSLGHCFLMMDNLQEAYNAYQQALCNLRNPKEPKLWYGIGILYDRYGSLEHAEEAFSEVMRMQPDFEKANEIYFRLGIIYKQQSKYNQSLECFKYIVHSPPHPLTEEDIWFQIGHVYEQQKDFDNARVAYVRVLDRDPNHAKVLQQLGWLHHQSSTSFSSQEKAIEYLEKSVAADNSDAQSWYLLGRCYMSQSKYPKAYEAYQQAVYRDGRNPTFWCSIGVLYYQINQYRDALDAYSRAIRLNPYISEVWYDLGTLYESCNNQISDALDAYQRAADLDPANVHIKARLQLLRSGGANGVQPGNAPQPTDIHPLTQPPAGPAGPQWGGSAHQQPPPGPPTGPPAPSWSRINDVNPPPQPPNPYRQPGEPGQGFPGPGHPMPRQMSPRMEQQARHPYQDPARPPPLQRRPSPPPSHYQQQNLPPPPQPPQQPPSLDRVPNPTYQGPSPSAMPPVSNGPPHGPPQGPSHPQYRGTNSPRPGEGRPPLHDSRMPSPKSAYPQQHQQPLPHYGHHPEGPPQGGMENGPAPPQPPMQQEGPIPREHERPSSVGAKRMREWEDDTAMKKPANEDSRSRLSDITHRRPSTPPRDPYRRNSAEARHQDQRRMEDARRAEEQRRAEDMRRAEEQRHPNDGYHPSEAAHHAQNHSMPPQHLPPMQQSSAPMQSILHDGPQAGPASKEYPPDERQPIEHGPASRPPPVNEPERAARKMDVDEDYDDNSGDDEKKPNITANGSGPGSAASERKTTTPTSAGMNGIMAPAAKVEAA